MELERAKLKCENLTEENKKIKYQYEAQLSQLMRENQKLESDIKGLLTERAHNANSLITKEQEKMKVT